MARIVPLALVGAALATTLAVAAPAQPACAGNRNMCDALASLQQARDSLQRADSNKGGYRAQALKSVDRAIMQVRNGIRYSQGR